MCELGVSRVCMGLYMESVSELCGELWRHVGCMWRA